MSNIEINAITQAFRNFVVVVQSALAAQGWGNEDDATQQLLMGETLAIEEMCEPLLEAIFEDSQIDIDVRLDALKCVGNMLEGYIASQDLPENVEDPDPDLDVGVIDIQEFSKFILANYHEQVQLLNKISLMVEQKMSSAAKKMKM